MLARGEGGDMRNACMPVTREVSNVPGDACCCAPRSLLRLPGSPVLRRSDLDPLIEEVWSC
jgi:hypothetical protein